nr:ubiquitin-conjugating enzyme E2 J1 [Jaculus jaculus]
MVQKYRFRSSEHRPSALAPPSRAWFPTRVLLAQCRPTQPDRNSTQWGDPTGPRRFGLLGSGRGDHTERRPSPPVSPSQRRNGQETHATFTARRGGAGPDEQADPPAPVPRDAGAGAGARPLEGGSRGGRGGARASPRPQSGQTGRRLRRALWAQPAGAALRREERAAMESRYNLKSPAVKRLMKEAAELKDPTDHYHAQPLEDNLFEWHFTVRGPPDSDFDGGVYHGRIVLPPEYPMKPPSIILLTANGRFEVGKKICLSISGHHPETWQPSWSIRTALLAIIGFMPTKGEGAIGSLDYTPEERRALAKKSQDFCCEGCGSTMKNVLLPLKSGSDSSQADQEAKELARQISFKAEINSSGKTIAESDLNHSFSLNDDIPTTFQGATASTSSLSAASLQQPTQHVAKNTSMSPRQRRAQQQSQRRLSTSPEVIQGQQPRDNHMDHGGSAVLIVILTLALAALIFRRIYLANEYIFDFEL